MYKVLNWRQRKRWGFFIEASTEERDLCCAKKDDYDETRRVLTSPDESRRDSTTRMGFEPTHAEHIGLAVQRLNHSATSSHNISHSKLRRLMWQTFCIPLGLECCRNVFMCNDRNVLSCSQIGQLLQSLRLTMNDVSFTTQKNRTTPFWKTKRPWGWGLGIGRNSLVWLCLHRGQTSVAYFFFI